MGGQLFQPLLVVVVQAGLVVVDEDAGGDVHGVDQHQALAHAAVAYGLLDLRCDVNEPPSGGNLEPELFAIRLHRSVDLAFVPLSLATSVELGVRQPERQQLLENNSRR